MKHFFVTIYLVAAILLTGCAQSTASAPAPPAVEVSAEVPECINPAQKSIPVNFKVAESSDDGYFIRVATNGAATKSVAKEIIKAYANGYDRIDICEPDHTERGEECMSYMSGVLIDYRTGESITVEL